MLDKATITAIGHLKISDVDTGVALVRRRDVPPQPVVALETPLSKPPAGDTIGARHVD
jgi:hypothetical protein